MKQAEDIWLDFCVGNAVHNEDGSVGRDVFLKETLQISCQKTEFKNIADHRTELHRFIDETIDKFEFYALRTDAVEVKIVDNPQG